MSHHHHRDQRSKALNAKERDRLVYELSTLLWNESKPEGEEGVPEDQWEAVLTGPCNGDTQLIQEIIANERWLRAGVDEPFIFEVSVPAADYLQFLFGFFTTPEWPISLLWNIPISDWYPEENWDQLLEEWTEGTPEMKENMKAQARELRAVRETGRHTYNM